MVIFPLSRGKNCMSQGVENWGSQISVPWPSGLEGFLEGSLKEVLLRRVLRRGGVS